MKISKVNHTKSAVAKNDGMIKGILYQDPGSKEDLHKRFGTLNSNAQKLYKILNQVQVEEKQNQRRRYEDIINGKDGLNNKLKDLLFIRQDNGFAVKKSEAVLKKLHSWNLQVKGKEVSNDDLDDILTLYLRKSLRKGKAGLRTLFRNAGNTDISQEDQKKISEFVTILREDYTKNNFEEKIRKSIENQNLIVQPVQTGNREVLALSTKKDSRSGREKQSFSDFLTNYANLDSEKRMNLLRKLRRLVDLYFNADGNTDSQTLPEEVNIEPNYDVWAAHEAGKTNNKTFAEYPEILSQGDNSSSGERKTLDSVEAREARGRLKENIRKKNIECYRNSLDIIEKNKELFFTDDELNHYWIHHIENAVERILSTTGNGKRLTREKLLIGYLSEKVWKDCLNTMSIKYIAVGKAVYHFALDDLADTNKDTDLLKIADKALDGITSFDYEEIKANETLQREVAVDVSFAANNLSRATVKTSEGKEDFLVWNAKEIRKNMRYKEDGRTLKAILQFFGGASRWDLNLFKKAYKDSPDYEIKFLDDLRKIIFSLRNESFHFTTQATGGYDWNTELIGEMFEEDAKVCMALEKKKFYSNNLPMFYNASDLQKILDFLYKENPSRASQVPSFKTVFVRKNFPDFLASHGFSFAGGDAETRLKWQNALYYLLKEIYYNAFLTSPDVKDVFFKALDDLPAENEYALKDFKGRCGDFQNKKEYGLPEICQFIMTEYNEQNAGNRKVRSSKADQRNPKIFQHYRLLLMHTLQSAFSIFLDRQDVRKVLEVLKHPDGKGKLISEEEFLNGWSSTMYKNTINAVKDSKNKKLQAWYITARFLNARTLNLLAGSLRSYIQYARDVCRRAKETGNQVITYEENTVQTCEEVLPVLDLCMKLSSVYSNELTDYFFDNEEYAKYLSNYVNFYSAKVGYGSTFAQLQAFDDKDLYMDKKNPIPNRNIVMSKLFGPVSVLSKTMSPVTEKDINDYYDKRKEIAGYMVKGQCSSEEEQKRVIEYQRLKNHVELRDAVEFGEIINELLGQLINWSYLRERDLLYFQLGFHYLCLNNDDAKKPEGYIHITRENGKKINGAILSQVAGMYINGIPFFAPDDKTGKLTEQSSIGGAGKKIGLFGSYAGRILHENKKEALEVLYNAGLELFETLGEHDNVVDVRNAIDHFKYYTVKKMDNQKDDGTPLSILDYYSEVFDRFFEYDMKYQKTVVSMLQNVLLRHFVLFFPSFSTGKKKVVGSDEGKARAQISAQKNGISSDTLTYKIKGCPDLIIDAKSEKYREVIGKILYYPYEMPDGIIGGEHQKKGEKEENSRRKSGRNPGKFRQGKKEQEQEEKELNNYKKKNNTAKPVGTSIGDILNGLNIK